MRMLRKFILVLGHLLMNGITEFLTLQMYGPDGWFDFMNETFPAAVQIVMGEAPANSSLSKRSQPLVRRNSCVIFMRFDMIFCGLEPWTCLTKSCRLVRRATANDSPSYSRNAIQCGDAIDIQGVTMEEQFQEILTNTRNISHIRAYLLSNLEQRELPSKLTMNWCPSYSRDPLACPGLPVSVLAGARR